MKNTLPRPAPFPQNPPLSSLLRTALKHRAPLLTAQTNALRLIDGEGDGFPDLFLETYADRWLLSTRHDWLLNPSLRHELSETGKPVYWKHLDQNQKTSPHHLTGPEVTEPFPILENDIRYRIDFSAGYSQGIFLDQRDNRQRVRDLAQPGQTVLNTFAYTGAFSVCAAMGGATTTTLDLSQPYLDWAKENFRLNELDPAEHYFCKGDTFHWLKRFSKQGRQFNGIILDPPTFSRDKQGNVFSVEKDYGDLFALALSCLAPGGWILSSTNCRKLDEEAFRRQLTRHQPRGTTLESAPMPPDFNGEPYLKALWLLPRS
ncbi:class I SAM-dependent rRNA methyltransferase [Roseibacillus persicicus]|uniref:S-adenosylmethionine-dependent methyltransferase domain-containing protein n=1 Tax=Roseibacillus persicicus TaxID=454148 RepID=A0A918TIW6_9BACT|nr:class I SAM-dependent rRNA methyltransferase [Roseibacillus persicicus]GHC49056.1 hypothetical protein GCM10007100_13790 [Roseibacillus persicicus]